MTEKTDQDKIDLETLTDEEQKLLAKSLKKVEAEVFQAVLKRLSAWITIVLSILLVGGLINLSSCYSNVENSTAQKLANDPELRDKIITQAQGNFKKVEESFKEAQEKLKALSDKAAEIERQNARASITFVEDLEQIRFMIERINQEMPEQLPTTQKRNRNGGQGK